MHETINNYLGSTKFLQLHSTAAVHLLNFCKVCMEVSSSSSSVVMAVDLLSDTKSSSSY